jgi:hypothetical protein
MVNLRAGPLTFTCGRTSIPIFGKPKSRQILQVSLKNEWNISLGGKREKYIF